MSTSTQQVSQEFYESKYARKVREHRQLYGDGKSCCGNREAIDIIARLAAEGACELQLSKENEDESE